MDKYFDDNNLFREDIFFEVPVSMGRLVNTNGLESIDFIDILEPPVKGSFNYYGDVVDSADGLIIPAATVSLYSGTTLVDSFPTESWGGFNWTGVQPIDKIVISSAEYITGKFPADLHRFTLERKIKVLDPVLLPPGGSKVNSIWWLVGIGALAYVVSKKKSQ
jgi:hypothetical protein